MQLLLLQNQLKNESGFHFIDSTPVSTCLNRRIFSHKVTKKFASRGKSTKGWFYGFKLHGVCSEKGLLESVVFTSGSLYEAIRASISLPLFFSPVKSDGRLLVDGGLVNPLPLNRVMRSKEDLLVAVNVSGHDYLGQVKLRKVVRETASERSRMMSFINRIIPEDADINYYTLMNRSVSIMIQKNAELSVKLLRPDILIDIPMNRYDTFDFDKYDRLAGIGRAKTKKVVERWLQAK